MELVYTAVLEAVSVRIESSSLSTPTKFVGRPVTKLLLGAGSLLQ